MDYGNSVDNSTTEENCRPSPSLNAAVGFCEQGNSGSEVLLQQSHPAYNWDCQLKEVALYNGLNLVVIYGILIIDSMLPPVVIHLGSQIFMYTRCLNKMQKLSPWGQMLPHIFLCSLHRCTFQFMLFYTVD